MSEHEQLCNLIADLIAGQERTTEAVVRLAEAIANAGQCKSAKKEADKAIETAQTAAKYEEQKAIRAEPPAEETTGPSYADTAAKVLAVKKEKGTDAAVAILKQFGASKLPEVKESDFASVITACEAALA